MTTSYVYGVARVTGSPVTLYNYFTTACKLTWLIKICFKYDKLINFFISQIYYKSVMAAVKGLKDSVSKL